MVTKRERIILCFYLRRVGVIPDSWFNGLFINDNRIWLDRYIFNVSFSDVSYDTLKILAKMYVSQRNSIVYHKYV